MPRKSVPGYSSYPERDWELRCPYQKANLNETVGVCSALEFVFGRVLQESDVL
jgi:hypothetical protein